jgi:hypothetical protein
VDIWESINKSAKVKDVVGNQSITIKKTLQVFHGASSQLEVTHVKILPIME